MLPLNVINRRFGSGKQAELPPDIQLFLSVKTLSVRDLIALTVEKQINELLENQNRSEADIKKVLDHQFLPDTEWSKPCSDKSNSEHEIDVQHEIDRALKAFTQKHYRLIVNKRNLDCLDQVLDLSQTVEVQFLRITPLIGG